MPALFGQQPVTNDRTYTVGVLTDNYPHSFIDENQQPAGFAVDLLAAIERTMGLKFKRVIGDTREINGAFTEKRLDMLQSWAQSPERDKVADFSVPYLTMTGYIFTRRDTAGIRRLEDLRGRRVMVHKGSLGEQLLVAAGLSNCVEHVDSVEEAFRFLNEGKGDATLAAQLTGLMTIDRLRLQKVVTTGEPIPGFQVRYCLAVQEGDRDLLAKLNEGLALIERTGEAERIYRKWFGRVDPQGYSAEQIMVVVAGGLALALGVALWAMLRQRTLNRRIAKQAEQLRASEEEYRGVFELSLFGLMLVSEDGGIFLVERVNAAALRLLGTDAVPRRGTEASVAFPGEKDFWENIRTHLADPNTPEEFEHARPDKKGAACLRVTASRVGSRVQIVLADVTAAKLAEEKLRRQDQQMRQSQKLEAIGTLASGIAHDFNNILTSIYGHGELMRMDLSPGHPLAESNDAILKAAERASKLVRQILSFCRHADSRREVIELTPLIEETLRFLRSAAPSTIEIRNRNSARGTLIQADPTQIHQVLMNLCTNAVQAMRGRSGLLEVAEERIHVGPEVVAQHPQLREGDFLRVSVRDTGCGIDPEILPRIFDPFFTTKAPGEGTGLGLAVVHGILHSHQGAVTVYSQPGEGSVFQLYFPVAQPGVGKEADVRGKAMPHGQGELVLFIDDEEPIRRISEQLLQRLGYRVSAHCDVVAALTDFQSRSAEFAVVLSDLTMPLMSGLDVVVEVRRIRPDIPVILASGYLGESEMTRARALRVTQLLDKPLTLDGLATAVASCVAQPVGARHLV